MRKQLLTLLFCLPAIFCSAQIKSIKSAESLTCTLIQKSIPLRDLPTDNPNLTDKQLSIRYNESLEHDKGILKPYDGPLNNDEALQRIYGDDSITSIDSITVFQGMSASVDPSDNTLAVSAGYVVQMVNNYSNSLINVWDKAGNILVNKVNTVDITGFSDYGDPNIVYDQRADRFVFCTLSNSGNKLIIAISESGDPTGSWLGYSINFSNGFPDYPKIAVWGNSYFITTNSNYPTVWAINRDQLLAGGTVGAAQRFDLSRLGTIGFQSASPVTETGAIAPPDGAPAIIMRVADDAWMGIDSDHLELYFVSINWENSDLSEISGSFDISNVPYDSKLCGFDNWNCVPQPITNTKLDPLSDIVMDKVQYLRFPDYETIVCSHVCRAYTAGYSGIRWYELRKYSDSVWSIFQQGTFAPNDSNYRFMPSITMNAFGTIALGYNISSTTVYPGIRVTGRTICDSINMMTAPEAIGVEGTGSNGYNRYGDYNNMVTDPLDGSFWFTANYNPSTSWKTKVIHFYIDTCTIKEETPPAIADDELILGPNPVNENLNIFYNALHAGNLEIKLYDILGQVILNTQQVIIEGNNAIEINMRTIANGTYIIVLHNADKDITQKLIVQH